MVIRVLCNPKCVFKRNVYTFNGNNSSMKYYVIRGYSERKEFVPLYMCNGLHLELYKSGCNYIYIIVPTFRCDDIWVFPDVASSEACLCL